MMLRIGSILTADTTTWTTKSITHSRWRSRLTRALRIFQSKNGQSGTETLNVS